MWSSLFFHVVVHKTLTCVHVGLQLLFFNGQLKETLMIHYESYKI